MSSVICLRFKILNESFKYDKSTSTRFIYIGKKRNIAFYRMLWAIFSAKNMRYCLIILALTCGICEGQNLVPNPSFEDTLINPIFGQGCPHLPGDVDRIKHWIYPIETPDYFNRCATQFVSVPENISGHQQANSGNAYVGIISRVAGLIGYTEMLGVELTDSLTTGKQYFVSLKVSLGDNSNCATNKIGVRFTTKSYDLFTAGNMPNYAHVFSSEIISDKTNWTVISGSFTADSNYKYIFIGNFFDNNQLDSLLLSTDSISCNSFWCPDSNQCWAYYYIDDVCVSEDPLICDLSLGVQLPNRNEGVNLFPNPFNTLVNIQVLGNEVWTMYLYDIASKELIRHTFMGTATINTEQLSKGMYFYELRNSEGTISKGKLMKQ